MLGEAEHDLLLERAADGDRARIDAAVAGIDGDEGTRVASRRRRRAGRGDLGGRIAGFGGFAEGLAIGPDELDAQEREAARVARHVDPRHEGRLGKLDDDAGPARREQAIAKGCDQTCPLPGRLCRQVERHLRQVDDDPVGALHGRDASGDLARQGEDEMRPVAVAGEIRRHGDGRSRLGRGEKRRPSGRRFAGSPARDQGGTGGQNGNQRRNHGDAKRTTRTNARLTLRHAWLMEPQAAVAPLPCLPGHRRSRFSLAKRRHRPVMKAIPVRHGRIDGGPAGRRSALDRSCRIACPVSSALPGRWSIERRHAATRWPVRSRCVSIESIKMHECDRFQGVEHAVLPRSGVHFSAACSTRLIDFAGPKIYGRIDGISCLPSCASRRRRTVSHPSPPAPISGEIGGPDTSTAPPNGMRSRDQ